MTMPPAVAITTNGTVSYEEPHRGGLSYTGESTRKSLAYARGCVLASPPSYADQAIGQGVERFKEPNWGARPSSAYPGKFPTRLRLALPTPVECSSPFAARPCRAEDKTGGSLVLPVDNPVDTPWIKFGRSGHDV